MEAHQPDKEKKEYKGFVALISVLLLLAIAVTVITVGLSVQIDRSKSSDTSMDAVQASANANLCAEFAISKLKDNLTTYTGNETLTTDLNCGGSCQINTITGSGNTNRLITVSGVCNDITKKLSITISNVNPFTTIASWQEVADF
jgi:hypothetical protein